MAGITEACPCAPPVLQPRTKESHMSPLRLLLPLVLILPVTAHRLDASSQLPVSGEAVVLVIPDQVVVTLGIEIRQPKLAEAQAQFDEAAKRVNAAFKELGIAPEHVRTACLEIAPYYHENSTKERLVPEYYRINRTITVTLSDITRIDTVVSSALTAGATHVIDVDFRTTELRKHRDEARRLAVRAARDKATLLAGELDLKVTKAVSLDEGSYGWYAYNPYRSGGRQNQYQSQNTYGAGAGGVTGDTLVPPGQIAVSASVRVIFSID